MTLTLLTACIFLLHLLGVLAAMHAVVHTRTPQGAIGWGLGLVLLPYITLLPYAYLGASRFSGYLAKRAATQSASPTRADDGEVDADCTRFASISALQGRPFLAGHRLRLL